MSRIKKVSVYSGKGGTGKSTLSINLARYYAKKGLSVCVVDCDEQQTVMDCFRDNLLGFDVFNEMPKTGYDIAILDHHPTHSNIALGEIVVCPIRPSKIDFMSYRRSRAVIGQTPHILVINQIRNVPDDQYFHTDMVKLCKANDIQCKDIEMRIVYKKAFNLSKTVYEMGNDHGASKARNEINFLGGMIDEKIKL